MLSRLSSFSGPLSPAFRIPIGGFTTNGLILRYIIGDTNSYNQGTSLTDLQGNSNGTLVNGSTYSLNGYLNFDGSNDYLMTNTSLNSKLSPNTSSNIISVFTWFYPEDNGVIVTEQGSSSLNSGWHTSIIEVLSSQLKFCLWSDLGNPIGHIITYSISLYNWYYVGLTYDGTTLRAYVNGQIVGTSVFTRSTPNPTNGLHYAIAANDSTDLDGQVFSGPGGTYAKMKFGDFHVYNTALTQQQILNNYNYTKSNYIYTGSMSIWIDANDPESFSGGLVNDLSGNNYNHTLTSGATSSTVFGFKSFDCSTGDKRIVVNGTGPTLPTTGYTYVVWSRLVSDNFSSFRTLLYTNSPKYTPITITNGTNTLGYWDSSFRTSGYGLTSSVDVWVQYAVVGDNSSQTFYINDTQVGNTISYGAGGTTHWGLGGNDTATQPFGYVGNMMFYNKKLTQIEIKQNYDALKNVYKNGDFVVNNLKLYFNPASYLSYPNSGTTVTDLSGNSLNGTLSNVTFNKTYFTFNGSNSQIAITDNALLEPGSGDWTMEVWIKPTSLSAAGQVVLGKFDPGGLSADISYAIRISSSNIRADFSNGSSAVTTSNYTLSLNTWIHLTYVFNNVLNNNIITYINGASYSTTTHSFASILNTSANLYLGSYNNGEYPQYFTGQMGIVRLYSSALSSSDVSKNFEANRGIYGI